MNQIRTIHANFRPHRDRQRGALTLFTAALILILMTLMLFYAARVGIFEQRVSANDMNQKLAFHAAEAGVEHAIEYLFANNMLVASEDFDVLLDGSDGWLAPGVERWRKCSDYTADFDTESDPAEIAHPCRGESSDARRAQSYFYYYDDPAIDGDDPYTLNIDTGAFLQPSQAASIRAVLCVLVVDFNPATNGGVPVSGCTTDTAVAGSHFMVTILAHGESDCAGGVCRGEALITEPVSNFSALNGPPPSVPLTTRSTFPPGGTAEIVTNPNAGGIGVPISVWASGNTSCSYGVTDAFGNGNWATCEAHEWYAQDAEPADLRCQLPAGQCTCRAEEAISNTVGSYDQLGIDMFWDTGFPCDLFEYYFGVPKSAYLIIKNAAQIVEDCNSFGPDSSGLYWVSGPTCNFPSNIEVGTKDNPIAIVSAATQTSLNGNTVFWGVLFITDVEDATAEVDSAGTNYVYGAMVVDAPIDNFAGTLKLIYAASEIVRAHGSGNLGALMGGWTDFPKCWHAAGAGCP